MAGTSTRPFSALACGKCMNRCCVLTSGCLMSTSPATRARQRCQRRLPASCGCFGARGTGASRRTWSRWVCGLGDECGRLRGSAGVCVFAGQLLSQHCHSPSATWRTVPDAPTIECQMVLCFLIVLLCCAVCFLSLCGDTQEWRSYVTSEAQATPVAGHHLWPISEPSLKAAWLQEVAAALKDPLPH